MKKITWMDPYLDLVLNEIPIEAEKILEVGCGSGILGYIIKKTRSCYLSGIEPFDYELGHYDLVHRMTWKQYYNKNLDLTQSNIFDVVVCNEAIEHMEKKEALEFLEETKKFASTVIITTPFHFDDQPAYDDNPYQLHKCLLSTKDFLDHGYKIRLIGLGNFPPKPQFIRNLYRKKKSTFKKLGISKTPITSGRMLYPQSLKLFYEIMGFKTNNIIAIWTK